MSGVTGYTGPENLPRNRFSSTMWPSMAGSSEAPMTAIDRASARCSQAVITARDFSVGSMSNARSMTPESYSRCTVYPASMNTPSILVFWPRTSAVKRPGRDHLPAEQGDQPDPGVVVHIGEDLDLPVGDLVDRLEVPHVERLLAQPAVHGADRVRVGRTRRPQVRDTAVDEQHVGLPPQRVCGRRCSGHQDSSWGVEWTRSGRPDYQPVVRPGSIAGVVGVQPVQWVDHRAGVRDGAVDRP